MYWVISLPGSRESLLVRTPRLVIERLRVQIPARAAGEFLFFRVNFVCRLLFGVRSTPVLLQWHVKDPGHCAKSADDRLHLNTYIPWTQRSRSGLTMPLCRHSVGIYPEKNSQPQSFQLAEPLWTDLGLKSGIFVRELICTSKKKKRRKKKDAGGE